MYYNFLTTNTLIWQNMLVFIILCFCLVVYMLHLIFRITIQKIAVQKIKKKLLPLLLQKMIVTEYTVVFTT